MGMCLKNLLKYIEGNNVGNIKTKIISSILRNSNDSEIILMAEEMVGTEIEVDISELKSLIAPEQFKFPKYDLGIIGVDNDENN